METLAAQLDVDDANNPPPPDTRVQQLGLPTGPVEDDVLDVFAQIVDNLDDDVADTRRLDQLDYMDYILSEKREQLRAVLRGKYHDFRTDMQEAEAAWHPAPGQPREAWAEEPAPAPQRFEDLLSARPHGADATGDQAEAYARAQHALLAQQQQQNELATAEATQLAEQQAAAEQVLRERERRAYLLDQKRQLEEALARADEESLDTDEEMEAAEAAAQAGAGSTEEEQRMLSLLRQLAEEKERLQIELHEKLALAKQIEEENAAMDAQESADAADADEQREYESEQAYLQALQEMEALRREKERLEQEDAAAATAQTRYEQTVASGADQAQAVASATQDAGGTQQFESEAAAREYFEAMKTLEGLAGEKVALEQELQKILASAENLEQQQAELAAAPPSVPAAAAPPAAPAAGSSAPRMLEGVAEMLTADEDQLAGMLDGANQEELVQMMQTLTAQREMLEQEVPLFPFPLSRGAPVRSSRPRHLIFGRAGCRSTRASRRCARKWSGWRCSNSSSFSRPRLNRLPSSAPARAGVLTQSRKATRRRKKKRTRTTTATRKIWSTSRH